MPEPKANLFWTHPFGHPTTIPCGHFVPEHSGHTVSLPLGRSQTVPCTHLKQQHPGGHPGINTPCEHLLTPVSVEFSNGLVFFTDNAELKDAVRTGVNRLNAMGVNILQPRPLNIFNREPINGDPGDDSDPFWHHYDRATHSIQITKGASVRVMREAVHHEMGHALLGHSCVRVVTPGGSHSLTDVIDPGLAMSEGWAHFVALAIEKSRTAPQLSSPHHGIQNPIQYQGMNWETMSVTANPNVEYCVGCTLWDLFDVPQDGTASSGANDEESLSFAELFKVFSPTLQTLPSGPVIPNIGNYLNRLKQNNPGHAQKIDRVKKLNVGTA